VAAVSDRVRRECDVVAGAERLEAIYRDVIADSAGRAAGGAAEQIALVRFLEQNLQRGVLYNRQLARQRFMSEPNDELVAMFDTLGGAVNELNRRVAELTSETRHLARFQPAAVFLELWRRARAGFRPRA
ncbi:MAG: hypothetical protein QOK29_4344, partial [Rhodospirillaceae bacterium]|nr:hypothetical protein [Rhodospirillaceae bacterium]